MQIMQSYQSTQYNPKFAMAMTKASAGVADHLTMRVFRDDSESAMAFKKGFKKERFRQFFNNHFDIATTLRNKGTEDEKIVLQVKKADNPKSEVVAEFDLFDYSSGAASPVEASLTGTQKAGQYASNIARTRKITSFI